MNALPCRALVLLISIGISGTVAAGHAGDAREWLERMTTAMSQMTYQGTFVYVRDGVVETMRITHITDEAGVRERLYSVSGPHREVIRDRKGVRCFLEDSASVVEDRVVASSYFPDLPLSVIDGASSGYRLETGASGNVLGLTNGWLTGVDNAVSPSAPGVTPCCGAVTTIAINATLAAIARPETGLSHRLVCQLDMLGRSSACSDALSFTLRPVTTCLLPGWRIQSRIR